MKIGGFKENKYHWKTVKIRGLSRYEVSDTGSVRIASTLKHINVCKDEDKNDVVMLHYYGKPKKFLVSTLLYETFKLLEPKSTQFFISTTIKSEQFSNNEEDYGKGPNKIHWETLSTQIKNIKIQEEKRIFNEQDNSTDQFPEV